MTEDPTNPRHALEASLTALLLGELPPDQAAFLRQAIATDPELARMYARLERTIGLVRETAAEPAPGPAVHPQLLRLSAERREQLLQRFKTVNHPALAKPERKDRSWLVPMAIAASLLLLAGAMLLPGLSRAKFKSQSRIARNAASAEQGNGFRTWSLENNGSAPAATPSQTTLGLSENRLSTDSRPTAPAPNKGTEQAGRDIVLAQPSAVDSFAATPPTSIFLPPKLPESESELALTAKALDGSTAGKAFFSLSGGSGGGGAGGAPATPPAENRPLDEQRAGSFEFSATPTHGEGLMRRSSLSAGAARLPQSEAKEPQVQAEKPPVAYSAQDRRAGGLASDNQIDRGISVLTNGRAEMASATPETAQWQSVSGLLADSNGQQLSNSDSLSESSGVKKPALGDVPALGTSFKEAPAQQKQEMAVEQGVNETVRRRVLTPAREPAKDAERNLDSFAQAVPRVSAGQLGAAMETPTTPAVVDPITGLPVAEAAPVVDPTTGLPLPQLRSDTGPSITNDPNVVGYVNVPIITNYISGDLRGFYDDAKRGSSELTDAGRRLFEQGKVSEAEAKLKEATKKNPQDNTAYYYLNQIAEAKFQDALNKGDVAPRNGLVEIEKTWATPPMNNNAENARLYADARTKLQELQHFDRVLRTTVAGEKTDLQLPKNSMVDIVDMATAKPVESPSLGQKLGGLFSSTVERKARIKVERDQADIAGADVASNRATGYDPYFVQSETEVIRSDAVLGPVVDKLKLDEAWAKKRGTSTPLPKSEAVKMLKEQLDVKSVGKTDLLDIGVKSAKPEEAANLANAVAESYRARRLEQRKELGRAEVASLQDRLAENEQRIREAQTNVDYLRAKYNVTDYMAGGNAPTVLITAETLRRIEQLRIENQAELVRKQTLLNQLNSRRNDPDALAKAIPASGIQDQLLGTLREQRAVAEQQLASLRAQRGAENAQTMKAAAQVQDLNSKINDRVTGLISGLETQVTSLGQSLTNLQIEADKATRSDFEKASQTQPYWEAKSKLDQLQRARTIMIATSNASQPNLYARTNLIYQNNTKQTVDNKLNHIRLDAVRFENIPLRELATRLSEEAKKRDPEKRGVNFVINEGDKAKVPPGAPTDPTTGLPLKNEPMDFGDAAVHLPVELKDVTLAQVLDAVVKTSDKPIKYSIESYGVVFSPATPAEVEERAAKRPAPTTPPPEPQPEIQTRDNSFSTFSLNVSDVSFKLAGASLEKGVLPEPASIRTEEFINAFDYRDPEPASGAPIAFAWERARYPFAQNRDLLRFSLKTAALGRSVGRPLNLVLVLDNSGSMERADRVSIIREALRVLATQLQPNDMLSVVLFARTPRLWVDGAPGNQAGKVADEISGLTPEGGTNLGEALDLAYQTALRHYQMAGINRVVLLTDGAANLGNVEPEELKKKVEANRRQGVALDCFGIGWEGYNDDLLEVLTRNGDGRYGFINTPEEASTEFAGQLAGALHVAASDVKVQVEFNPKRVTAYRQIGYAKHQLTKEQFRDNSVDAAELGAAESGNALYVVDVNGGGDGPLATVRVRYKVPGTMQYQEHEWTVPYAGNATALEQATPALKLAASASAFSEWLATSPYAAEVTPDSVLGYLHGVPEVYGADARPKKLEWMIRQAKSLAGKQ